MCIFIFQENNSDINDLVMFCGLWKKMERGGKGNSPARSLFSVDCPNRHLNIAGPFLAILEDYDPKAHKDPSIGHYTHPIQ